MKKTCLRPVPCEYAVLANPLVPAHGHICKGGTPTAVMVMSPSGPAVIGVYPPLPDAGPCAYFTPRKGWTEGDKVEGEESANGSGRIIIPH